MPDLIQETQAIHATMPVSADPAVNDLQDRVAMMQASGDRKDSPASAWALAWLRSHPKLTQAVLGLIVSAAVGYLHLDQRAETDTLRKALATATNQLEDVKFQVGVP